MKIKYFGTQYEKGLTLTVSLFTDEGTVVHQGFPMTETGQDTAIYITANVFDTIDPISPGIYVARVQDDEGNFLGYSEIVFNGIKEVSILEFKFWSEENQMELRDALGLTGAKKVATGGQLQKKSEYPHNSIIDTTSLE